MKNRQLQGTLAFVGLVIFGLVWIITSILGLAQVNPGQTLAQIFGILKGIAVLLLVLVVAFVGWEAASEKALVWKVIFLVVAVLSVVGAVLALF